ncbi:MAG: hypothetical protein J6B85_06045 [Lachnospiraceae bacterium]|nr:hypothetical protein [Lachnospiraceae bacterium]
MLRTDYKDDIFSSARKYKMIDNGDGTISLQDVTEYTQEGDVFGAAELNGIGAEVNNKAGKDHTHNYSDLNNIPSSFPPDSHTHPATEISGGTLSKSVVADTGTDLTVSRLRNIQFGTEVPESIPEGSLFFLYEE